MKLRDLEEGQSPADLPFISESDYTFLWIGDYWDGPKSGMLILRGVEYRFECFSENSDDATLGKWYRRFAIVALTPEQLAKEHEVHRAFELHVATHWNVGDPGAVRPRDQWHHFYDKYLDYCRSRPYLESEVIAWFEQ